MNSTNLVVVLLGLTGGAFAQQPEALPQAHHVIGLENIKHNASGKLTVQNGAMEFTSGKTSAKVPLNSIDDIFVGTETTQSGGKVGTVAKTASIAAPFHTGSALTLLLRTKVDLLTVEYRDAAGALHAVILSLPKGQAVQVRSRLVAAGAHASAPADQLVERDPKEGKNQ